MVALIKIKTLYQQGILKLQVNIFFTFIISFFFLSFAVDYSKLPRSSGDGMEFSSSNSSDGSSSEGNEESDSSQRTNNSSLASTVKRQSVGNSIVHASTEIRTGVQAKTSRVKYNNDNESKKREEKGTSSGHLKSVESPEVQKSRQDVITRTESLQLKNDVHIKNQPVQRQNSTNLLLQGPELARLNKQLGLSLSANDQLVSLAPPALDLNFGDGLLKSTVVEQTAEFVDSQKVISDLQEQNSKLVEEKTKLSVQLGVQTKVWESLIFIPVPSSS